MNFEIYKLYNTSDIPGCDHLDVDPSLPVVVLELLPQALQEVAQGDVPLLDIRVLKKGG